MVLAGCFPLADCTLSGDGFTPNDIFSAGVSLTNADFEIAMDEARSSYSQNIGAPKTPNVSWDDVGGLADVKADILDTVQLPLEHPELFGSNLKKRSGTLTPALFFVVHLTTSGQRRDPSIWTAGHGQDSARQGGRDLVLAELLLCQRPRAAEHVHRRVGSERPSRIPACARRPPLRRLLRRAGLGRSQARRARRLGRRHGPYRLSTPRRTRRHLLCLCLCLCLCLFRRRRRLRDRRDEQARLARPRATPSRAIRQAALPRRERHGRRAAAHPRGSHAQVPSRSRARSVPPRPGLSVPFHRRRFLCFVRGRAAQGHVA